MRFSRHAKMSAIGVDLGSGAIKAVQLVGREEAWQVAASALLMRPDAQAPLDGALVQRLVETLRRQGFTGTRVVAAMPGTQVRGGVIELTKQAAGTMEETARRELAAMHRLNADDLEIACWPLPASGRMREANRIMATGCTTADATAFLDLLEGAGLHVAALDTPATALARAWQHAAAHDDQLAAMLDLGHGCATLVLLCHGSVIYERRLPEIGMGKLHQHLTQMLNVDTSIVDYLLRDVGLGVASRDVIDAAVLEDVQAAIRDHYQDLPRELSVSFSYATHQYPDAGVNHLALVGGGAAMPGLAQLLAQQTGVTVAPLQMPGAEGASVAPGMLCLAMGLALHEEGSP